EADGAARDRQRRDEHHLKDEQESHQRSDTERLVRFAQVDVWSAAAWQRRTELRVDEAVAQREQRAGEPRVEDVRSAHRLEHEGDRQERPDADHHEDIRRGRLQEAETAIEFAAYHGWRAATSLRASPRSPTSGLRASACAA